MPVSSLLETGIICMSAVPLKLRKCATLRMRRNLFGCSHPRLNAAARRVLLALRPAYAFFPRLENQITRLSLSARTARRLSASENTMRIFRHRLLRNYLILYHNRFFVSRDSCKFRLAKLQKISCTIQGRLGKRHKPGKGLRVSMQYVEILCVWLLTFLPLPVIMKRNIITEHEDFEIT